MLYPVELRDLVRTFSRYEGRHGKRAAEMLDISRMDSGCVITEAVA